VGDLLSDQLLDDLKAWNQSWDDGDGFWNDQQAAWAWEQQGWEFAIRVQNELGTDRWEVLYHLDGRLYRVHPPGSWPTETWRQDLLGYAPPDPQEVAEEEAWILDGLRGSEQEQTGADSSNAPEV
jgi:hypothetical protein